MQTLQKALHSVESDAYYRGSDALKVVKKYAAFILAFRGDAPGNLDLVLASLDDFKSEITSIQEALRTNCDSAAPQAVAGAVRAATISISAALRAVPARRSGSDTAALRVVPRQRHSSAKAVAVTGQQQLSGSATAAPQQR